jgi:quinolinate synthase
MICPDKHFYLLSPALVCVEMKKTTLEDVAQALRNEEQEVRIPADIAEKAAQTVLKMWSLEHRIQETILNRHHH